MTPIHPLVTLQQEIRRCSKCFPDGGNRPVMSGSPDSTVMVIGQAPSLTDSQTGRTFSGPGGKRLREWFAEAGVAESSVYYAALTKCYPGRSPNGKGDRVPSRDEVNNCRPHLLAEIELLDPKVVLLIGGMAIREFLGKGALTDYVGKRFPAGDYAPFNSLWGSGRTSWIVPLPHCSGASLWLNAEANRALLQEAIGLVRQCLRDDRL